MSEVSINVSSIVIGARRLAKFASRIESVINHVDANLSKIEKGLFYFNSEITKNQGIVITMQFTFDGSQEHFTFHNPSKKEVLEKAREIADKINDHNQVAVIFKEIRRIFRKRDLELILDYKDPKCAEVRFLRNKGDLKYTIADDHLHLHRDDIGYKDDEFGVSVSLGDPELLKPAKLESNLRSMLCRIADYKIAWMTAVREKVESLSFFNSNWGHSADSVFKEPR